jgi:hypothetical protein
MSTIDIGFLAIVLFAFVSFAGVLAYYNQTCAAPRRARTEPAGARTEPAGETRHLATAH